MAITIGSIGPLLTGRIRVPVHTRKERKKKSIKRNPKTGKIKKGK